MSLQLKPILEQRPTLGKDFKGKDIEFSDNEEDYLSYNKYTGEQENNITSNFKKLSQNTLVDLKVNKNLKSSISADKAKVFLSVTQVSQGNYFCFITF